MFIGTLTASSIAYYSSAWNTFISYNVLTYLLSSHKNYNSMTYKTSYGSGKLGRRVHSYQIIGVFDVCMSIKWIKTIHKVNSVVIYRTENRVFLSLYFLSGFILSFPN